MPQIKEKTLAEKIDDAVPHYTAATRMRDYSNLSPGISGKPGLLPSDYFGHRPEERIPTSIKDIIFYSDEVYRKVGLIWNVVNLMTDFTVKGIRPVHKNKKIEQVYINWFQRINGQAVSERFVNYLYRLGNTVVQRYTAKIKNEAEIAVAAADQIGLPQPFKPGKKEIPYKYVFLHPGTCEIIGGPIGSFSDRKLYGIKLSNDIVNAIKFPKTPEDKAAVDKLPPDILKAANTQGNLYTLPEDKTIVYHFKKDDWQTWANPIISPILDDLVHLSKMKLADMCALDGSTSKIRGWLVGDLATGLAPTDAAVDKLAAILASSVGAGTTDVIWGPDLKLIETNTDTYQFLGKEKYEAILNSIYSSLGVPISLTANYSGGNTTNNYMSLKTLTERLEYGRSLLIDFWEKEFAIFQQAMGYRFPAQIEFDQAILANEDQEKQLLIQLADRNLISDEMLQQKFGMDSNMEKIRLNRENKERQTKKRVPKAGQWFDPQTEDKMKLSFIQTGVLTPSQVGLELPEGKPEEIAQVHKLNPPKLATDQKKNPGQTGKGRPPGKKDSTKRKSKPLKTKSGLIAWASTAQKAVSDVVTPLYLNNIGKENLRQLTDTEFGVIERLKFNIFCGLTPFGGISPAHIIESVKSNKTYPTHLEYLKEKANDFTQTLGREPNTDEIRMLQLEVYSELARSNHDVCPICYMVSVGRCRCMGPHSMEDLKAGHGLCCENGHTWSDDLVYDPNSENP